MELTQQGCHFILVQPPWPNTFTLASDDKDDAEDHEVLGELENIDDDCEQAGVPFVKIDNDAEAKEYGIDELPTLVYFENRIPSIYEGKAIDSVYIDAEWWIERKLYIKFAAKKLPTVNLLTLTCPSTGDLSNEQEVLRWLMEQKTTDTIEEVTDEILDDLIANFEYVVVYFSESHLLHVSSDASL